MLTKKTTIFCVNRINSIALKQHKLLLRVVFMADLKFNDKEKDKLRVLELLVNNKLTAQEAAIQLNVHIRTIWRLKKNTNLKEMRP